MAALANIFAKRSFCAHTALRNALQHSKVLKKEIFAKTLSAKDMFNITPNMRAEEVLASVACVTPDSKWALEAALVLRKFPVSEIIQRMNALVALLKKPELAGKFLRSNPTILESEPEIFEHFDLLTSAFDYTQSQVFEILCAFPDAPVIAYNFTSTDLDKLIRLKKVLRKLFTEIEFWTFLRRYPKIVKTCPDGLERKIEKLQALLTTTPVAFRGLLLNFPKIIRYSPENIAEKVQALRECTGLEDDEFMQFVLGHARLFSISVKMMLERKEFLKSRLGLSEQGVQQFIVRFSALLGLGTEYLSTKVNTLSSLCFACSPSILLLHLISHTDQFLAWALWADRAMLTGQSGTARYQSEGAHLPAAACSTAAQRATECDAPQSV
jgi:hypothetical protein